MPEHENIGIVRRIGAAIQSGTISAAKDALHPDVAWHYFNPVLSEVARRLPRRVRHRTVFALLTTKSKGTFSIEPLAAHAFGGELIVTHGRVSSLSTARTSRPTSSSSGAYAIGA